MKNSIYLKLTIVFAVLSIMSVSCEKTDPQNQNPPQEEIVIPEPIAHYTYNGTEYPVHAAGCIVDDNVIAVKISPLERGSELTTYALIGINSQLEGVSIDVDRAWHNDDYYFIYEDPVMYYSQFRKLKSGTILMKKIATKENCFYINIDVVLPDGADFKFEYNGYLEVTE